MNISTASDKVAEIVTRIERLPLTSWQVKARVIVGVATFFDAFDFLTIAFVLPVIMPAWSIKPQDAGLLISAGAVGQLVGAIFLVGWRSGLAGFVRPCSPFFFTAS